MFYGKALFGMQPPPRPYYPISLLGSRQGWYTPENDMSVCCHFFVG